MVREEENNYELLGFIILWQGLKLEIISQIITQANNWQTLTYSLKYTQTRKNRSKKKNENDTMTTTFAFKLENEMNISFTVAYSRIYP